MTTTTNKHTRTCHELGVCQNRTPPCTKLCQADEQPKYPFAPGTIDAQPRKPCGTYCLVMTLIAVTMLVAVASALAGYLINQATPTPIESCAAERFAAQGNQAQVGQHRFTCTLNHDR